MARPFGEPALARAAARVVESTEPLIRALNHADVDATMARRLLLRLCTIARETIPDYDSARQIAWSFKIIYRESVPDRDPLIEQALADLEKDLDLSLPPAKAKESIVPTLSDRLKRITHFDPVPFQQHFKRIAERLEPPPKIREARR